jgi:hypothetical protein
MQVLKTQVQIGSGGRRKYGKRKYELARVENASTETVSTNRHISQGWKMQVLKT